MGLRPAERLACGIARGAGRDAAWWTDRAFAPTDEDILKELERRLGRLHAKQRIGIEDDREARVFGQGLNFFHPENWGRSPAIIRTALKLTGLYWRAQKNAENVQIRHNDILLPQLPSSFDGLTLLHISDLHVDISGGAMRRLTELLPSLAYDLCVLTGDYRGKTFGPFEATIEGLARVCAHIVGPIYGVLGNHDSIRMVPPLEEMGIRMLLNEAETLERGDQRIHLVGIDDAHYYRVDNIEITLDSVLPRRMGSGLWKYRDMVGYTSVGVGSSMVAVRLNCLPEITLHHLRCGEVSMVDHVGEACRTHEKAVLHR